MPDPQSDGRLDRVRRRRPHGVPRRWAAGMGAVLGAVLVAGCGPDEPATGADALPAPVAAELKRGTRAEQRRWQRPSAAEAERTRRYLDSARGRPVNRFAAHAKGLEGGLTPGTLSDRCRKLARTWEQRMPSEQLRRGLEGLPDQPLADATDEQRNAVLGMFDNCRAGNGERARDAARIAHVWARMYERRTTQMEVTP